ncbi:nucleoside triphosphate pyrophosphohydrolase [Bacillus sp. CGMCC 1.16607]|uniref:nucleoside triphosphate pyrophosphohydrolase n=1 Tax=Bacillus sp. CGMCC 1.16607 TaxID=3351842 RepID=UPI00363C401B
MKNKIEIIGLGAGDLNQIPLGVYKKLLGQNRLFLRTKEHPVVKDLEREGVVYTSFDYIYEENDQFDVVYEKICQQLLIESKESTIVYAVPGHPLVAEKTVQLLLEKHDKGEVEVEISGGQSFIDSLFQSLKIDPVEGFQLLDGTALNGEQLQIQQHIIISQVYDAFVASEVKLTLMEKLPDEYPVFIVTAAGSADEILKKVKLYELDREMTLNNLTSLYVPPVKEDILLRKQFSKLREIISDLRGPNGCPWDKKQTHESLKKYLIEETFEVIDAINKGEIDLLIEELGDVLLQVMLHAQIGEDEGFFSIDDVIENLANKMVRRHPHVFGDAKAQNADEVTALWEEIKGKEKENEEHSLLDGVGFEWPNLIRAYELQKRAAKVGFDWDDIRPAFAKVYEEIKELEEEMLKDPKNHIKLEDEFGDILFALVNVSRFLKIQPEEALFHANEKFKRRFQFIEKQVKESGKSFQHYTLDELDQFWNEAKQQGL